MARIYVSSTSVDLEDHRKTVSHALRRLGHEDVAMDYYVAEDTRPLDRSLNDVASSDVYVGIFAYRYGYVPSVDNPERRSITELEYRKAQSAGIPCLIFLLSDDAPWPTSKREKGEGALKIDALREEFISGDKHVVNFFESADELARKVNEAVIKWATASGLTAERQFTNWDAYREAVINKHQWVRLQVIAGASKDRGPVRIPLTEVFEAQLATAGASGTDVPDEVRKYQEVIYGPRAEATAANYHGETPEDAVDSEQDPLLVGNPEQVLDLVGREATQVILGGPGSGKSTILQYVMLRVCQIGAARDALPLHLQDAPIPFLIDLRNYVLQEAADFTNYIVANALEFYDASLDPDNLAAILQQPGQALVLFDGLDEVFDPDERRRVIDQFQTFAHRYPQARLIVTSRIAGYDRTALSLGGFEHYTLLPLTLGQIRHFAEQWYQYYTLEDTDRSAQGLVQRIIESPRLLDLAGNPLLLTMMAVIYKDRDLPNERWRLYERCAETLLEDWELGKGIEDEDFKLDVKIRTSGKSEILQRVSMYMLEHGQQGRELNAIAYGPLLEIIATYLQEKYQRSPGDAEAVAVDILKHLMERTYVLAGIGERIFGFVHRTFMEYFAACHCKEYFNKSKSDFQWLNNQIFGAHWREGEWEEVLLLLIAMLHDQKTPIYEVIEQLQAPHLRNAPLRLAFAARCLGEAGDLQNLSQGQAVLEKLAKAIEGATGKPSKTSFLEDALKSFASLAPLVAPPPESVGKMIAQMDSAPLVATRIAAWQMAFAMRSRKERLAYALAALQDRDESVRRGAIAALEREWPGRADIGETLTEVIRSDRQARVRQGAMSAMQRSWRSAPGILDAISSRIDEESGHRNVIKLAKFLAVTWRGNPKALKLVIRLTGPMPKARDSYDYDSVMAEVLPFLNQGWSGDAEALAFLKKQATTHRMAPIRSISLQTIALGWTSKAGSLKFLQERAADDPDPTTRATGLKAIAHSWKGDEDALRFVEDRANAETELDMKMVAFKAIVSGWSGSLTAYNSLNSWAKNSNVAEVRMAALKAIQNGWGRTEQAFNFVKERAVDDPDPRVRKMCLEMVAGRSFEYEDRYGHNYSVVINRGQTPEANKFLIQRALNEPELAVRESVFQLFRYREPVRPDDDQFANLSTFLSDRTKNDPEPLIRLRAIQAMLRLPMILGGHPSRYSIVKEYLQLLKSEATSNTNANVRILAINIMGTYWGDPESTTFLIGCAANDPDSRVRTAGLQTLEQKRNFGRHFKEIQAFFKLRAASDPDPEIRKLAQSFVRPLYIKSKSGS